MPTRLKNLCEAAKELYGQQYDRVVAGSTAGHENVACTNAGEVVSDGEEILVEKSLYPFKKSDGTSPLLNCSDGVQHGKAGRLVLTRYIQ